MLQNLTRISPRVLNMTLALLPIIIVFTSNTMELSDYILSGSFLPPFRSCCETFDFIVVGGGSSGSALAARLSENPSVRVLLLEAGGNPNPLTYIPATTSYIMNHNALDWGYRIAPQNHSAYGVIEQRVLWPRGKSLGGSSNSNFMIYMRGNPRDFDRWAVHTGDNRWKYKNVEKYFNKIEDYYGAYDQNGLHSKNGPLRVESVKYRPGVDQLLAAAKEMGYDTIDPNINQKQGFSPLELTQKRGTRFSTYRAYILPNMYRRNLVVYRYTLATKIHLNEKRRAVGVSYVRHGAKGYAIARKEIIVTAGVINSPQVLMLSGIGPKRHLREVGIQPLVDLPVGQNLQDHVSSAIGPFLLNQPESLMLQRDLTTSAILNFFTRGTGLLTSPQSLTTVGLVSTKDRNSDWPDIMYTVLGLGCFDGVAKILDDAFNLGTLAHDYLRPDIGKDSHVVLVTLGLPKSRGFIKLQNKNPQSKPIINPRYYSDPENHDITAMLKGVEIIVNLYENTTVFQKLDAHLPNRALPGCEGIKLRTKEYYECYIRTVTLTNYHPTSTCSMGKAGDPIAVVDSQLRVHGVKNLRVADASVMPYVTNANTNAPSIMIAELGADMIKRAWNL